MEADCPVSDPQVTAVARWPRAVWPWLSPRLREKSRIPPLDPLCPKPAPAPSRGINIVGISEDSVFRPSGSAIVPPTLLLEARGGEGELFWLLNGELIARCGGGETRRHTLAEPGRHRLTVMDLSGNHDAVSFYVIGNGVQ